MKERISFKESPGGYQAMRGLESYLSTTSLAPLVLHLVKLRVSQINGCAFCIDMHWKDLRALGETEQRLYGLDAWEESPYYTDRERAVLAWSEAVTRLQEGHVSDAVYESCRKQLSDRELSELTYAVVAINGWNRLSIAFRVPAGAYVSKLKSSKPEDPKNEIAHD